MNCKTLFYTSDPAPVCLGTGLIALDVVIDLSDGGKASVWAGGSCGNVLTILAFLGWSSYPIANHKDDSTSKTILDDLARWGVKSEFMFRSKKGVTPIVIEKLYHDENQSTHKFHFKCPVCGAQLPRNRPISYGLVSKIESDLPSAKVFYFDRVSKAAVNIAKQQKKNGALVIFEPSILSREQLFRESLEVAHVVKYSTSQIDISHFKANIPLEIQTLGAKGLKFRSSSTSNKEWQGLPAFSLSGLVDSTGAGDWCTAGIVHSIGQKGADGFIAASAEELKDALLFGEALAALKCMYKGARGIMYNLSREELLSFTCYLLDGRNPATLRFPLSLEMEPKNLKHICSACP